VLGSGLVDTRKIYVLGGSHGGFLATHLISQYPTTFLAAAVRNPVVNIAANYLTCDIPDWCLSETGTGVRIGPVNDGATSVPSPGNEELLLQMFRASPVAHIDRVQTPLLLLLGKNDVSGPKWNVPCWSYSVSPMCLLLLCRCCCCCCCCFFGAPLAETGADGPIRAILLWITSQRSGMQDVNLRHVACVE